MQPLTSLSQGMQKPASKLKKYLSKLHCSHTYVPDSTLGQLGFYTTWMPPVKFSVSFELILPHELQPGK